MRITAAAEHLFVCAELISNNIFWDLDAFAKLLIKNYVSCSLVGFSEFKLKYI